MTNDNTPPADDVREALARVVEASWGNPTWDGETLRPVDRKIADAILATFEVRPRGTVTDAEVRAARDAYDACKGGHGPSLRAALEAARNA